MAPNLRYPGSAPDAGSDAWVSSPDDESRNLRTDHPLHLDIWRQLPQGLRTVAKVGGSPAVTSSAGEQVERRTLPRQTRCTHQGQRRPESAMPVPAATFLGLYPKGAHAPPALEVSLKPVNLDYFTWPRFFSFSARD